MKRFLDYYLVWYKPNNEGNRGPNIAGSVNYRFGEYVQSILNGSADNMNQVSPVIKSLGNGLENNIDIVIALVTSINKTLIIDGAKRCLALFYLKAKEEKKLMDILASAYSINIVTLKSSICRILFPVDFANCVFEFLREL